MQINKILLTGILCALLYVCCVENSLAAGVSGQLINSAGDPVPSASVKLENTRYGTFTNLNGMFEFTNLNPGRYKLAITSIGYSPLQREIEVQAGQTTKLRIKLLEQVSTMDAVSVTGRSVTGEVNRQAFNVTAVDARKLHNSTLDLSQALDRISGVRVREAGGVGSSVNFSMNGFTGRQVKFFLDGIPMDNFGSSFQINNIPVNLAGRIEVYKGVVPVWLGADALGGAVNIISDNSRRRYLDVSYSYGSFNTHRSAVNAGLTTDKGLRLEFNAFQNYSDNNYWINVDVSDINKGTYYPNQRVRRFHDAYRNETIIASAGIMGKPWADKLMLGITMGQNKAEIQTGARMVSVFGDWHRRGNIVMPSIKYQKKNLLVKGLSLALTGNYNLGEEQNIDTAYRRYNWFKQYKEYAGQGSERERSMYKYKNNTGVATTNISYTLNDKHSVSLNNVFNTFDRKGSDELYPNSVKYAQPRKTRKNILGLGYKFDASDRLSTSAFLKSYAQRNTFSQLHTPAGETKETYKEIRNSFNKIGYGIASSYLLTDQLQLKASYEKSYRLPETEELYGDMINIEGNTDLKPEHSNNFNVGISYETTVKELHNLRLSSNFIYRNSKDFIRPELNRNQTKQLMGNLMDATNAGFDAELRYTYKNMLAAGINATYQNLRNNTRFEKGYTTQSILYRDRIPNMPFLYGNADVAATFKDFAAKGNTLSLGYNLLYVHAYYLYWPSMGSEKMDIPRQLAHDATILYSFAGGKYNIGLECKNLMDSRLYDNFSLQKPGRGFYAKLRYFIGK